MLLTTMFSIASLNVAFYPYELLFCVTKLTEKRKGLEPSIFSDSIAIFILDFLVVLRNIYYFIYLVKHLPCPEDCFVLVVHPSKRSF